MSSELLFGLAVAGGALLVILLSLYFLQRTLAARSPSFHTEPPQRAPPPQKPAPGPEAAAAPHFPDLRAVERQLYRLALNVSTADAPVHAQIEKAVAGSIEAALAQQSVLPRRPLLIPRLMRVLNDEHASRRELAEIILQDPVLTGDVLQYANSSYYRIWRAPVETIDRALKLLGSSGLKAVLATSVMRPVFNSTQHASPDFSKVTWQQALLNAEAAGLYADNTKSADRFSAHLLGLLSALGGIALFRLSLDVYAQHPSLTPSPATLLDILDKQNLSTSTAIARRWELAESFLTALQEQASDTMDDARSPLGKALYYGRLCGALALLHEHGQITAEESRNVVSHLGMQTKVFEPLWRRLTQKREAA